MIFHIDPDSGAITLGKILDRETAGWHNITVKAVEAGTLYCFSFQTHRLTFIGAFKQLCLIWSDSIEISGNVLVPFQLKFNVSVFSHCQNASKQHWKRKRTILTSLMYSLLLLLLSNRFQMSFSFVHISSQNYREEKHQGRLARYWKWSRKNLHFSSSYQAFLPLQRKHIL